MALQWNWKDKMGKLTIRQKGKKYNVNIYSGNAIAVFIYEYADDGKEMYSLYDFFADKKHVSKIISNRKKLIDDDVVVDAVGKKIVEGGYVNNWKLFRRWVTAQIFGMLRDMKSDKMSFNELLQRKGYEYQWRMLENEFYAQAKMQEHGDTENLSKRGIFFNECTFSGMVDDYIEKLKAYVNDNLIFRKVLLSCSFISQTKPKQGCELYNSSLPLSNHLNILNYDNSKKSNKNPESFRYHEEEGHRPEADGHE